MLENLRQNAPLLILGVLVTIALILSRTMEMLRDILGRLVERDEQKRRD